MHTLLARNTSASDLVEKFRKPNWWIKEQLATPSSAKPPPSVTGVRRVLFWSLSLFF
jgi:hypothetical protein